MPALLSSSQIDDALQNLEGWIFERDENGRDTVFRKFEFDNFVSAWAFLTRISFLAEQINHHPEIHNVYNRVRLTLTTHDSGNKLTDLDMRTAERINQIFQSLH